MACPIGLVINHNLRLKNPKDLKMSSVCFVDVCGSGKLDFAGGDSR